MRCALFLLLQPLVSSPWLAIFMPFKPIHYRTGLIFVAWAMACFWIRVSTEAAESVRIWKATPARPYVLRGADRRLLDRAEQFVVDEQWDDAVTVVLRLLEPDNFSVVSVGEQHYISLPEYCHRMLAKLPVKPLARYRQLVDASAESWYRQGIKNRDSDLLQRVVDNYFCSSWGDDALFAIGELALQRGDYQAARNAWLQLEPPPWGFYPGSDLSPAMVQARLVLVSVRESNWKRAEHELVQLRERFSTATGQISGREGVLVEELSGLLKQARQGRALGTTSDWRTYGANSQRTNPAPQKGAYQLIWSQPIENEQRSIFPVIANDLVIYQDSKSIRALRFSDGEQVFLAEGKVFHSPNLSSVSLGQPHHTLTANKHFVFGVTTSLLGPRRKLNGANAPSTLWSLDLQRDGAIALLQPSDEANVAFVGAPVRKGTQIYVPIRSHDPMARIGIACYDLSTGARSWQRWLCQANTPATGWANEIASNMLTYDSGILYINTNLGAIAAVRAEDGMISWLRTYERQSAKLDSKGQCAYYRGPSPCVYHRGILLSLPTDSEAMFAFDASMGEEIWRHENVEASLQFLHVSGNRILVSYEGLQRYDLRTGQKLDEPDKPWDNSPFPKQANLLSVGDYVIATGLTQLSVYRNQPQAAHPSQKLQASSKE